MVEKKTGYLFEVSWEVCNKVGGIYTVISSKAREAVRVYGENYYLLGPDLKNNLEFEETDEECWAKMRESTAIRDIPCRFGRWLIPGNPKAILVNFRDKYDKDQLLYRLWEKYGVDSISGQWDYIEPVMFSNACGEVIEIIYNICAKPHKETAVAHFHEWMSGAGLLAIKQSAPEIGTVFTTHATILGRTLAGSGMDIYLNMENISPLREAGNHNITAKYSMEATTAREADCITTVSEITGLETKNFLGRSPDVVTPNGLDMESIPDMLENREAALRARERLLEGASRFLRKVFRPDTKILAISGRYEFHNKGLDVFLNSLGRLEKTMGEGENILVYLLILAGHTDLISSLQCDQPSIYCTYTGRETGIHPIATHRLDYEGSDPILQTCTRLGLKNTQENKINVIFLPAYLNGHDGLLDMLYYEALSGCNLGVFPSYYEPWGYTPLESAAYCIPTVTTDQAGFGIWARKQEGDNSGVIILERMQKTPPEIEDNLYRVLVNFLGWTEEETLERRKTAGRIARGANWEDFYHAYRQAYAVALDAARKRREVVAPAEEKKRVFAGAVSTQPHFRTFTATVNLPQNITRLRELAYNLWWAWNPRALDLYAALDPMLWEETGKNPVKMLESISPKRLAEASENFSYVALYTQVLKQLDEYMEEIREPAARLSSPEIKASAPIAYFSTEYGIHETIPMYSGGLGTLSGDHLKTASDLNIPLVGIGLLYKTGFFRQRLDENGIQLAEYPENDFSIMPVSVVQDDKGNDVQISINLPGRTLSASIWEMKVGRVPLYLLSTNVAGNTPQDRHITDRLYVADQRTRIEQEILLGVGGVRLLSKLGIRPRVYHLNEGHSAFLILERISVLMKEGLNFEEACEVVRGSTVFTTHTPVEAGNERFPTELMEYYFSNYMKKTGISRTQFFELGRKEPGEDKPFFMTILALKTAYRSNAVSRLHGHISRHMWRDVWKGFHDTDLPIQYITNGVHTMTYLAPRMKELLDVYLGMDWWKDMANKERWARVQEIPDVLLWRTRYELKQNTVDFMIEHISRNWKKYGYSTMWREELLARINPSAMFIGFARRFAPYKRAGLLFSDLDRLERILNDKNRPVYVILSGKSHPSDEMGKSLIKMVFDLCRDEKFRGKLFFIEDYDIRVARHLVQGADVWLNTPRRPFEASGTSGEKVAANGGLNLSVSDGWWCEGYDGGNGWTIGPVIKDRPDVRPEADAEDAQSLYSLLENTIIPLFYDRSASGIPEKWIAMIKRSMQTLAPQFNTERMLSEYYQELYKPVALREQMITADSYRVARTLADWKRKLPMRFSSLRLIDVSVEGMHGEAIEVTRPITVTTTIDPGKMEPEELLVELMIGRVEGGEFIEEPECVPLAVAEKGRDGVLTFSARYQVKHNGLYAYGIRVIPFHENLGAKHETELIVWG